MTVDRKYVIQNLLDTKNQPKYLEIGVYKGRNFLPIKAGLKVGVDPKFRIKWRKKLKWWLKNPGNWGAEFHRVTSDEFFAANNSRSFDIVFIDGLHTYQQSLQDVLNALDVLADDGFIVMHDCHPPNDAAAQPANSVQHAASFDHPGWTGQWCGDVWKTICHLRSSRNDLEIFVLDCDCGLGIIRKTTTTMPTIDVDLPTLESMSFSDLGENKHAFLNLKHESYFDDYLNSL